VDYPFVQSNGQAQRLAKQRLERGQYQGKLTFSAASRTFWGLNIGDVFAFSHQAFGWSQSYSAALVRRSAERAKRRWSRSRKNAGDICVG
jgi:hypothetical protein